MSTIPVRVAVLTVLLASGAQAGLIRKVVAFPTADSLRVRVTLESPRAQPDVEVGCSIVTSDGQDRLWEGTLGRIDLPAGKPTQFEHTIRGLKPALWSPGSPVLYNVGLRIGPAGKPLDEARLRSGFRSVESRDGRILLNGKPIFLRGLAINPPGRGVPESTAFTREFAYDYVRFMRSRHFNCIRMNFEFVADPRTQHWFDACDELGMMVYQGCYGSPPTGVTTRKPDKNNVPTDLDASVEAYKTVFETYARHPAVIIYILSNELPYQGTRGKAWHEFLTTAHARLKQWDATRLYIGNAGYGEGKEGDINDVHRYWGWYYNSFLTYYNLRRAHEIFGAEGAVQPFTFSECVGSFTSTLGEVNLIFRKQLGAQLHWTGHSGEQAADALAYQAFMAQRACESFRTLREVNPRLAGLMPFTILFHHWNGIQRFEQMKPKPVADAMARAYQPVLLAWENWQPQVWAGRELRPWVHVINDAEDCATLPASRIEYELLNAAGGKIVSGGVEVKGLPYFAHNKTRLQLTVPQDTSTGDYRLVGRLVVAGKAVSANETPVFVAGRSWADASRQVSPDRYVLFDPDGRTARALRARGLTIKVVSDLAGLSPQTRLVIGEEAAFAIRDADLSGFIRSGGRVLLLAQPAGKFKPSWLPAQVEMLGGSANDPEYHDRKRPTADQMYINLERPDHPVFAGLARSQFRTWSDYTDWDQSRKGFPAIYPVTHGFKLTKAEDLARVAVLANYDRGLEGVALCEMFDGRGSVVFTGFDLVARVGLDPVADRLLGNLLAYLDAEAHPVHPVISEPIVWGRYPSEKGVICGPLNGLIENCRWVAPPTDPNARPMPDNEGAWNVLPGDQYVAIGRRVYGPYAYSTATSTRQLTPDSPVGTGFFHASVPAGRKLMHTKVENPTNQSGTLEIDVNGEKKSFAVPAGATVTLANPIGAAGLAEGAVTVRYTGSRFLVLLTTAFE